VRRATVAALVRKDLFTVLRNRGVRLPLILTPILVLGVLPIGLVVLGQFLIETAPEALAEASAGPLGQVADADARQQVVRDLPSEATWGVFVLELFLSPLYLLVPLIVATVIGADSFAGERERGTLEALLHTPLSDRELLAAKFLSAWIPAVAVAWLSFLGYAVLANWLLWPAVGALWFPTAGWVLLALWVAPGLSALGMALMVITSARVRTLQAAHQLGSLVVIPIILLLVLQVSGTYVLSIERIAGMGAVVWLAAGAALMVGTRAVRRERLSARL